MSLTNTDLLKIEKFLKIRISLILAEQAIKSQNKDKHLTCILTIMQDKLKYTKIQPRCIKQQEWCTTFHSLLLILTTALRWQDKGMARHLQMVSQLINQGDLLKLCINSRHFYKVKMNNLRWLPKKLQTEHNNTRHILKKENMEKVQIY